MFGAIAPFYNPLPVDLVKLVGVESAAYDTGLLYYFLSIVDPLPEVHPPLGGSFGGMNTEPLSDFC